VDPIVDHWVERAQLRGLRRLGWGDAGNSVPWDCTFDGRRYVFKEYSDEFRADARQDALGRLIGWRTGLPDATRQHLDRIAAWPVYRVRDRGILQGVLLPRAPDAFFQPRRRDEVMHPRTLAYLRRFTTGDNVVQGATSAVKHRALGLTAEALLWFHRQGVTVNDVRESNVLCSRDGDAVYYVDCDVMMGSWGSVGPGAAPEYLAELVPQSNQPTPQTDLARLAWVAICLLLDDFSVRAISRERLTKVTDPTTAELLYQTSQMTTIDQSAWHRFVHRTVDRWTAQVPVQGAIVADEIRTPMMTPVAPTQPFPKTRVPRRSHEWLPDRYRERPVRGSGTGTSAAPPAMVATTTNRPSLLTITIIVVAVVGVLGAASLLLQGMYP
jgi:hypothetical protein